MATIKPYDIVREFEYKIAEWAGSQYAVAVESCTAALFLSCIYKKVQKVTIPKYTYPSVPASIIHAGGKVQFSDEKWKGVYELKPYGIIDSALRLQKGMYQKGTFHCLSFHVKKHLPLGRGGMILLNDKKAYEWLKLARFDGRSEGVRLDQDNFTVLGYNMYMLPEQAVRGMQIFEMIKENHLEDLPFREQHYPNLKKFDVYNT